MPSNSMSSNSIRPSRSGLDAHERPKPCVVVIFGATGDLTRRELIPSLFELWQQQLLPERFFVIGFARREWNDASFRDAMRSGTEQLAASDAKLWSEFAAHLGYVQGEFDDPQAFARLAVRLSQVTTAHSIPGNMMFHLATPPASFGPIVRGLGRAGLASEEQGFRRVVIEKPFGTDRASAIMLDRTVAGVFSEDQTYRIDHFLGKETVQNMLVVRFANAGFEPIWNRNHIEQIQITAAEHIGIGTRGAFYEKTGVVRDMVQNHLLQLLCMCAIEPPSRFEAKLLRDETVKVLKAVRPIDVENDCVRGQYGPGVGPDGSGGYLAERDVEAGSATCTFAAMKIMIDNWRWRGVPFYLRSGKRLACKTTEVTVEFKPTPHMMFDTRGAPLPSNRLTFRLQPSEGIFQTFVAKQPGPHVALTAVDMNFCYAEAFGVEKPPRAYAWLMRDVMEGDQTLFARADWIEQAWRVIDPVIAAWESLAPHDFPNYASGSWGPAAADALLAKDGRRWHVSTS